MFTIGADFLWALFLKLFAGAFGGHVTFNGYGYSGWLFRPIRQSDDGYCRDLWIVQPGSQYCDLLLWRVYSSLHGVRFIFTYAQMDDDRKSYAYLVARVLFGLVFSLIGGILAGSMVESFINMIL